jgi:ubiquinone/menaquinone biosynthesis C-methylase UbiE
LRIARAVAPSGRAYAVDIDAKALERLRERAQKDAITNVEAILGETADPQLPAGELDAVLIRNAYEEMPEYRSILGAVAKSLKAGGVLVVIEAIREKNRILSREAQPRNTRSLRRSSSRNFATPDSRSWNGWMRLRRSHDRRLVGSG